MRELRSSLHDTQPGFNFRNSFRFDFRFDLPIFPPIELGDVIYGLCGGMVYATLDYHLAGLPIPTMKLVPMDRSPLWRYLWRRQIDSFVLPIVPARVIRWMLLSNEKVAQKTLEEEIPYLIDLMENNKPVVLALIRQEGWKDPTQNHQVLVTRIFDTGEETQLTIYDPNHPNRNPAPQINIKKPVGNQAYEIDQTTGEFLRGFFVIDYDFSSPPTDGIS